LIRLIEDCILFLFWHNLDLFSGVNFINILRVHFLYVSELISFSLIMFGFAIFGAKILHKKRVRKTLMKLRAGRNLILRWRVLIETD